MKCVRWKIFDSLPSTNRYAKESSEEVKEDELLVIWAREQTAGHGQFQRQWIAPAGNVSVTFCFCVPLGWKPLSQSALKVSQSVATVLRQLGVPCTFKWPNDLLVSNHKLAGVLCETVVKRDHMLVCAGIGINVRATAQDLSNVGQPATSLHLAGVETDAETLVHLIAKQLQEDLPLYLRNNH
ncbi:MAG: biotin--[acetyl-CoA-carboxylase] ligase [Verrucomicrobia bacterium]|nr:biotin--[acetyl-CoA-carboxylase] ligase [Verrucomicrobiota bacterium]